MCRQVNLRWSLLRSLRVNLRARRRVNRVVCLRKCLLVNQPLGQLANPLHNQAVNLQRRHRCSLQMSLRASPREGRQGNLRVNLRVCQRDNLQEYLVGSPRGSRQVNPVDNLHASLLCSLQEYLVGSPRGNRHVNRLASRRRCPRLIRRRPIRLVRQARVRRSIHSRHRRPHFLLAVSIYRILLAYPRRHLRGNTMIICSGRSTVCTRLRWMT